MTAAASSRRIVVAVDRSEQARAAVEAAADLARRLRAELIALFVEDVDLVRLAQLPFVREIGVNAEVRELDLPRIERRFRSESREAREACERAAGRCRVALRFDVVRGSVVREIVAAAEGAEMIVVGRTGLALLPAGGGAGPHRAAPSRLGRTAQALLASGARTVAVIGTFEEIGRPVAAVLDGGEGSRSALDLAIRLAGEDHFNLAVLVTGEASRRDDVAAQASAAAAAFGIEPRVVATGDGADAIAARVRDLGCRAVVVGRGCAALGEGGAVALVERLDCPVFVTG